MSHSGVHSRGLRIGVIGPVPPPNGGMAMQTQQLVRLLDESGEWVSLLPTNPSYRPAWVGRVPGLRALCRLIPYCASVWRLAGRVDVIHLMANSGWSWHLFAAPVLWLARLRGTPVVVNYRGGEAGTFLAQSARSVGWSLRHAHALVVPSGYLKAVFADYGYDCAVVPNIVDTATFFPPARDRLHGSTDPFTFVITRNLEKIYDIGTALTAFAQLLREASAGDGVSAVRLVVAGSGPEEGALRAQAEALGIAGQVEFAGRLSREAVAALYQRADALLNPTTVDNMPNSVIEALASGVPVISTDVGGVPYIVTHEKTALLVPPRDPAAMARAMRRVRDDAALRERLSRAGAASVADYTWQTVREQWLAQYRQAVGAPVCA
jgi:glycosyltransferase involved in cell wall biosynthesis